MAHPRGCKLIGLEPRWRAGDRFGGYWDWDLPVTHDIDSVVVGAGVVGLAVARALANSGRDTIVLESEGAIGTATSSRNSEVIHAGIYYAPGSLKAELCVSGKEALYAYCAERGIPHRRIGKLIVAAGETEMSALEDLQANARDNGVDDLVLLDSAHLSKLEPNVAGAAALLSPSTGIVDSHALMLAYQGEIEDAGGRIAFASRLARADPSRQGFELVVSLQGGENMRLTCRQLVNAAGLNAQAVARSVARLPEAAVPTRFLAKGSYFALSGRAPFEHLIYPVPEASGLGIHATLDMGGSARFGPDVEWVDRIDYAVDPGRSAMFAKAIRAYFPGISPDALQPAYAGIRPKIVPRGAPPGDFVVQSPDDHGIAGLVNLFGIESPGLTASLAIAESALAALEHH